jgi:geranylgeranyl reductase family protein
VTQADLLVIGGGPAGAATAVHAARAGLSVIVVDRARFPRDKPCAEYLSPEATRDLDDLGVLEAVEAAGAAKLHGFRLVSDDGAAVCGRFAGTPFTPYRPFGYALPRFTLDALLLDAARTAGAEVREGVSLERLTFDGRMVTGAELRGTADRYVVRARAVVGADGLNSLVARQLGLAHQGRLRRLALVAHLEGVGGMSDVGEMFAARGWYVGLAPLGAGRVNFAMVVPQADAPAIASDAEAFFLAKLRSVPELAARIAGARIVRRVLTTGPFARRARRPVADGALLVGDAADFYDPFTGEGIFAALRGGRLAADALVSALVHGPATRRALAPYQAARREAFLGKWVLERVVGLGATRPALMRRFTRQLARRSDITDLWVGAAGDSVPVRALFAPRHLLAFVV